MDEYPSTTSGDVQAWGLTWRQAVHHYSRLTEYYARQSQRLADLSAVYAARSARQVKVVMVLAAITAVLAVTALAWGPR